MKKIQVPLDFENYSVASEFVEKMLTERNISKEIIFETLLVFEALFNRIIEQGCSKYTSIEISKKNRLGELSITIGFEGKMFIPLKDFSADSSPEEKIMKAYDDKLSYVYHSSYNVITITVKRGQKNTMLLCGIGFLVAIAVYTILRFTISPAEQAGLLNNYVFPIEQIFTNAMLMIGAPVTFFSLVKNIMDTYIVAERSSDTRRIQPKTILTSLSAILIALITFIFTTLIIREISIIEYNVSGPAQSFEDFVLELVPSNIFEPFTALSPFPVLLLAALTAYACCSVGKYFQGIKKVIDACYTFFSRMLNIVMYALPLFCCIAFLDVLLDSGYVYLLTIIIFIGVALIGVILVFVFYAVRLKAGHVDIKTFISKLWPLIKENFKIASAIDAVPFNTRYCVKNYGYNRKRLEDTLPVLAQTNLDGNCLLLMLIGCSLLYFSDAGTSVLDIVMIGIMVLFLSLGAPNQPGSILIGTLIIISYLSANELVCAAIFMEAIFGSIQNIINVIGDIVIVAIEDSRANRLAEIK